jgi:hypothetical protein
LVIHPAESICFISGEKEKEIKRKEKKEKDEKRGEELPPDGSSCESEVSLPGCP